MSNDYNQDHKYDDELDDSFDWRDTDEWGDPEDLIYARKKHQNHRGRNKSQVRRNIDEIKERKRLNTMLGDDFDDELGQF